MSRERIAVIYDRASSPGQRDNFARADAARLFHLAEERGLGWELRQEIKSGEEVANRPIMRQILDEIAEGQIAALIVQDFTRLSRDEDGIDGRIIRQFCRDHGCQIITPEKPMTSRPTPTMTWLMSSSWLESGRSVPTSGR